MKQLVKVDRNGSKHYIDYECRGCGGKGYIGIYSHVAGGRCFLCDGTGYHPSKWVEHTPEYLEKKRIKDEAKKEKKIQELKDQIGDKKIYVVVVKDTYSIKEDIKKEGGSFDKVVGWYLDKPSEKFPTKEVRLLDIADPKPNGSVTFDERAEKFRDDLDDEIGSQSNQSSHLGSIGDKIELEVELVETYEFQSSYSYYGKDYIYKFKDKEGNILVWKTSCYIPKSFSKGSLTGKIKKHDVYKGEKQTVLIKCKVA